jgi:hypothetical protein
MRLRRQKGGDQHDQGHRPDLGKHDLRGRDRHHQQVLDGAVLALPDQRRASQDDGQQRDVVDDLNHRAEPGLV